MNYEYQYVISGNLFEVFCLFSKYKTQQYENSFRRMYE